MTQPSPSSYPALEKLLDGDITPEKRNQLLQGIDLGLDAAFIGKQIDVDGNNPTVTGIAKDIHACVWNDGKILPKFLEGKGKEAPREAFLQAIDVKRLALDAVLARRGDVRRAMGMSW